MYFSTIYKEKTIKFRFDPRKWYKSEAIYILVASVLVFLILPFYLKTTQAYLNWDVPLDTFGLIKLFIGINAVVLWDEMFFIATLLGIFRKYLSFFQANLAQAVVFTSFLFELGYTSWGPIMIFLFALLQGYIFKKTKSLFYVIVIHLVFDLVLFFALINAHYPELMRIFLT